MGQGSMAVEAKGIIGQSLAHFFESSGQMPGGGARRVAFSISRLVMFLAIIASVLGRSTFVDENGVEVYAAPMEHSGLCNGAEIDTSAACTLPVNANITVTDRGAGTQTPADVAMDVYPSRVCTWSAGTTRFFAWTCESDLIEPAIIHDELYKTVIRIIFPPGFDASSARLRNAGPDGVGTIFVAGKNYTNATTAIKFRKVSQPIRLDQGLAEPDTQSLPLVQYKWNDVVNRLDPLATIDFRTGTIFGMREPSSSSSSPDATRYMEIETIEEAGTEFMSNMDETSGSVMEDGAQRLMIGLEGVMTARRVGGVGSAIAMGERFFAVQVYKARIVPVAVTPEQGYLMRYYNHRINDPCVFQKDITGVPGSCPSDWRSDDNLRESVLTLPWFAATNTDEMVLLCPAGTTHQPDGGGTVCHACQPGYFSNETLSTSCSDCPAGTSADVVATARIPTGGASGCPLCSPGTYSSTAAAACTDCPPGSFSTAGQSSCSLCAVASFSNSSGSSACTSCPPATTTAGPGAASESLCLASCPVGYASVTGVLPCQICDPGTFASSTGATACAMCPSGSASREPGSVGCDECDPGSFSAESGEPECSLCPQATYSEARGSTTCQVCGPDQAARQFLRDSGLSSAASLSQSYVDSVAPLGIPLTADAVILRTTGPGASSSAMCFKNCLPGRLGASTMGVDASSIGEGGCRGCAEGTYNSQLGMSSCLSCALGTFASTAGSTACDVCAPGTFAGRPGSSRCAVCPAGQASQTQGDGTGESSGGSGGGTVSETDACFVCLPGTYTSSPGSPRCVPCPEGSYSGAGAVGCDRCAVGSYTFGDGVNSSACEPLGARGVVGMWDVWGYVGESEYRRARRLDSSCSEMHDTWVAPSTVPDWSDSLGDAVMIGPPCRASTGWDAPERDSLGLHSFSVNNGRVEALDFDGRLNTGLVVGAQGGVEELMASRPWALPREDLTVEMWLTLDGQATTISGLAGAYQQETGYARGWALNHVYDTNRKDSWFVSFLLATQATHGPGSLGAITGSGLNIVEAKVTPPPPSGTWFHLAVTYNGSVAKIYLDGDLVADSSPCGGGMCGDIVYTLPGDMRPHTTPFTVGSTINGAGGGAAGVPAPHRGMMRWARVYNRSVPQSEISASAAFGSMRYSDSSRVYTPWYWSSLSSPNISSPSTREVSVDINTLGPRLVRQGALESIKILGRFGTPPTSYTAVWSLGAVNQTSENCIVQNVDGTPADPATSHFGEVLSCPFPLWSYGRTASASLSVIMQGLGEVWQTACLHPLCGYSPGQTRVPNGPWWQAGGFHALNGTRFDFAFIATDCAEGTFAPEGGVSPYCAPCLQGSYSDEPGSVTCTLCPKGTYSTIETGATSCLSCSAGLFTQGVGSVSPDDCQPLCLAGSFSQTRLSPCSLCPEGKFASEPGSAECVDCPDEYWTRGEGAVECVAMCSPGEFEPEWGLEPCDRCPPGQFSEGFSSRACSVCGLGQWSTEASSSCKLCNVTCELAKDNTNEAVKNQCCTG